MSESLAPLQTPSPEPDQPPKYAMRLLGAGAATALLLVAVVVLTLPGGGRKAASHNTARPTKAPSTVTTPSDTFSVTPPVPPSVSPLHQTAFPRHTRSARPGDPKPPGNPKPTPPPGGGGPTPTPTGNQGGNPGNELGGS